MTLFFTKTNGILALLLIPFVSFIASAVDLTDVNESVTKANMASYYAADDGSTLMI